MRRIVGVAVAATLAAAAPAFAQERVGDEGKSDAARLEELEKKLERQAKQIEEAKRELDARSGGGGEHSLGPDAVKVAADMEPLRPEVDVGSEGFDESRAGDAADTLAEVGVIALMAALVTGFVRLYQRRLPLLGFLLGAAAFVLSTLAFLNSAT